MPVKKKPVRNTAKKSVKKKAPKKAQDFPLFYFKLVTGEEIAGFADVPRGRGPLIVLEPMNVAYIQDILILSPYGLPAKERVFAFQQEHITGIFEVDDAFQSLYMISLRNVSHSKEYYDQVVYSSMKAMQKAIMRRENLPTPTETDLQNIEKEGEKEGTISIVSGVDIRPDGSRSKSKIIDDLIKLANDKGKGLNAEAGKKED